MRNAVKPAPPLVSIADPAGVTDSRSPEPPGLLLVAPSDRLPDISVTCLDSFPVRESRKNPAAVKQQSLGGSGQMKVLSAVSLRQDHVQSFSDLGRCYWTDVLKRSNVIVSPPQVTNAGRPHGIQEFQGHLVKGLDHLLGLVFGRFIQLSVSNSSELNDFTGMVLARLCGEKLIDLH